VVQPWCKGAGACDQKQLVQWQSISKSILQHQRAAHHCLWVEAAGCEAAVCGDEPVRLAGLQAGPGQVPGGQRTAVVAPALDVLPAGQHVQAALSCCRALSSRMLPQHGLSILWMVQRHSLLTQLFALPCCHQLASMDTTCCAAAAGADNFQGRLDSTSVLQALEPTCHMLQPVWSPGCSSREQSPPAAPLRWVQQSCCQQLVRHA
jgi:hypothetical protein